jgi:putative chitinase
MTPITLQQLIAGTGCSVMRASNWLPAINEALAQWRIDTPARQAAWLAQIGHESGHLVWVREIWGPTAAQKRYEGRVDLGNVVAGDGYRYLGRGPIQITGRANYRAAAKAIPGAPDFEANPELLEAPRWGCQAAGWYWASRNLNALADVGDFERITRKINGGLNGQAERLALWATAKRSLGVA